MQHGAFPHRPPLADPTKPSASGGILTEKVAESAAEGVVEQNGPIDNEEAEWISQYVYDPARFVSEVFGYTLDSWCHAAYDDLLSDRFLSIRSGNGVGKTFFLAITVYWFLLTRKGARIPCVANSGTQLDATLWAELSMLHKRSTYVQERTRLLSTLLQVVGYEKEWYAIARAARNSRGDVTEVLQGTHAPYVLFVIDEASGVPDKSMDALESAMTNPSTYGIIAGNATRRSGFFFRSWHQDRALWAGIHVRPEDTSRVDPAFYTRMEKKYRGKDTNGYRIRVLGEFPTADASGLLSMDEYADPDIQIHGYIPDEALPTTFAIDPAGSSPEADATTIAIRRGPYIIDIIDYHSLKTTEIAYEVDVLLGRWHPHTIYIDSIGIGAGLADQLETLDRIVTEDITIVRVNVGTSAPNPRDHFNLRAQLYKHAADAIKDKGIFFCKDLPNLEADLTDIQVEYTVNTNKLKIEDKRRFRERNDGRSPDDADAFVMLFYGELVDGDGDGGDERQTSPEATAAIIKISTDMEKERPGYGDIIFPYNRLR
jgi:phage terminase large subunit